MSGWSLQLGAVSMDRDRESQTVGEGSGRGQEEIATLVANSKNNNITRNFERCYFSFSICSK